MLMLAKISVAVTVLLQPPPVDRVEQTLRSIKALTEEYKQRLAGACSEPIALGGPADLTHEDIALRTAFLHDDSARIAEKLGSARGRAAAVHLHREAARYSLQAYACHPLRQHLVRASAYLGAAEQLAGVGPADARMQRELAVVRASITLQLAGYDAASRGASRRDPPAPPTSVAAPQGPAPAPAVEAKAVVPPTAADGLADRRQRRVAFAVTGGLTGALAVATLGMGLSRVREPFEGAAHAAIHDAAVASWNDGDGVPYGAGVDMCEQGRALADAGVMRACGRFDSLGRATIATGVLTGVALATFIAVTVQGARIKKQRARFAAGWQPGGVTLSLSGRF